MLYNILLLLGIFLLIIFGAFIIWIIVKVFSTKEPVDFSNPNRLSDSLYLSSKY